MNRTRFFPTAGRFTALVVALWLSAGAWGAPPDWVLQIAKAPTPGNVGASASAVLLEETAVSVDPTGVATTTRRFAVRILDENGRSSATMSVPYLQKADKVTTTNAWLIRKNDAVKAKDGREWLDLAANSFGTLYDEARYKNVDRSGDAVAGDVFVGETVTVGAWLVPHVSYSWGSALPIREETFRLTLPSGFSIAAELFGEDPPGVSTSADGRTTTWTKRDQPYVRREPLAPGLFYDAPTLFVRVEEPAGAAQFKPVSLKSWADVAGWIERLNAGQCDASPQLTELAARLTAGCPDQFSRIRALGDYVQKLRYVAVNEGLKRGLGYQARKASLVFTQGYGDCKDKANLLQALLREAGVTATVAFARSGDDQRVRPEFPSPRQFDHAIAAIHVDDSVQSPAVVTTEKWGRLLFFDPTDPRTLPGDLPAHLQGTYVHLKDPASDALILLPRITPAVGHAFVRKARLTLTRDGTFTGQASVLGRGQAGTALRWSLFNASTDEKLRKLAGDQLGDSTRGAQFSKLTREEDPLTGVCGVTFDFSKKNFAQFLPNAMAMARLDVLTRGALPALPAAERKLPVKLEPVAFEDEVELILPDGFAPEEVPAGTKLTSVFGHYESTFNVSGNRIVMTRRVELLPQVVPVADYAALKKFLSDLGKADRASVLLRTGT